MSLPPDQQPYQVDEEAYIEGKDEAARQLATYAPDGLSIQELERIAESAHKLESSAPNDTMKSFWRGVVDFYTEKSRLG